MSDKALFDQATHTLTVIGQQEPTIEHLRILHDGYLSAVMQRIKQGNMMPLYEFRNSIGLGVLERLPFEVAIPALAEPFNPKDKFIVDTSDTAIVKIAYCGTNFTSWMMSTVVEPRAGYGIEACTLTQDASDEEILQDTARDDVDTDIAAVHHLVSKQPKGEDGQLYTDGRANILYVPRNIEEQGKIRAVRRVVVVHWGARGWFFGANAFPFPFRWSAGFRVFLRKRLDTVSV